MMDHRETVEVCVDLPPAGVPVPMGTLRCRSSAGSEVFSFTYDRAWLEQSEAFGFDPDLALFEGPQYPAADRGNFGIFLDSAPDRWGRLLMQRRESLRAREQQRPVRTLTAWDFLLGVHDETRLGALRFRYSAGEPFIDDSPHLAAPPLTSLRELQSASLHFEQHMGDENHPDYGKWIEQLFVPGSSLGGARPKASVRDRSGGLCLAKFPSRQDTRDVGAWELVAHRVAAKAGIDVPPSRPLRIAGSEYTTFLVNRFDRTGAGGRLPFVSAMTLMQRTDGEAGASYLELVDLLQSQGAESRRDCARLFRRVLFNILIHNTDDHLRNHGFFIGARGLTLSPAFDMNPTPDCRALTLAINETESACDPAIALDACADYGLNRKEAEDVLKQVRVAVSAWRSEASRLHISKLEQAMMAPAFQTDE